MENAKTASGVNKLKLQCRDGVQFNFSHFNFLGDDFKKLQTGLGFWVATTSNQSADVEPAVLTFRPSDKVQYIYVKIPAIDGKVTTGEKAEMVKADIELFDTDTHFFLLLKSGTYNELKF